MSGIALYYKLGWDRMDTQMREIASDVDIVNATIQDLGGLYRRTRIALLQAQLRSQDLPLAVILGDSIVEQLYCPALTGVNVFNAGISGAKVLESKPFLESLLADSKGPLVIVSMGVNDAFGEATASPEQFQAGYEALVQTVLTDKRRLVLVNLPPLEQDKPEAARFDATKLARYNAIIADIAARNNLTLVDIHGLLTTRRTATGQSQTLDGVHLNSPAAAAWRDAVYAAAKGVLAQLPSS
jgi:lysophospholipase L1-like esterase